MKALRVTERPEAIRAGRFVASMGAPYQVKFSYRVNYLLVIIKPAKLQLLSALGKYENRIFS